MAQMGAKQLDAYGDKHPDMFTKKAEVGAGPIELAGYICQWLPMPALQQHAAPKHKLERQRAPNKTSSTSNRSPRRGTCHAMARGQPE